MCDLETSRLRRLWATLVRGITGWKNKKNLNNFVNRYEECRLNPKSKSVYIETAALSTILKLRLVQESGNPIVPEGAVYLTR